MRNIILIIILFFLSATLYAKKGTIIPFSYPSISCQYGRIIELHDLDENGKYDIAFIYNCHLTLIRECAAVENYDLNNKPGYYLGTLIKGDHEGFDFVYLISETESKQTVAKLYFDADSYSVIIDKAGTHEQGATLMSDILDEYFFISIDNEGMVTLTKKKEIWITELKAVDLNGNEIVTYGYDSHAYNVDLSRKAKGVYFIIMLTSEGYLQKRIIFMKR